MPEATLLVLDNSEWMRNGDYSPNRFEAQADAVHLIFQSKINASPENAVGLITSAGDSPKVLVSLTTEHGAVYSALHQAKIEGNCRFSNAVSIAQLALKHRLNKNQQQRIIIFVGSPIPESEEELNKLGRKLKKNGVSVDVVNFGEDEQNQTKLEAFIAAVNSSENNCHLVSIPAASCKVLADVLVASPIIGSSATGRSGEDGEGAAFEFGVDPNLDPELALALRLSMEEERERAQRMNTEPVANNSNSNNNNSNNQQTETVAGDPAKASEEMEVEDEILAQAIAMSLESAQQSPPPSSDQQSNNGD